MNIYFSAISWRDQVPLDEMEMIYIRPSLLVGNVYRFFLSDYQHIEIGYLTLIPTEVNQLNEQTMLRFE